ncbi:DUF1501 domain-containing protein [Chthoniobacter flavus]|uniref:DUF1501 domain-containing protein n=1 Tax=Chthoniobacter flavus TaxID=191863 RepID=UPI001AA00126|nr:DUF1501 domain-containing protein [Chthoniobacter flavus]
MLKTSATGFAWMALSALIQQRAYGAPVAPQFAAKAKNVIFLFMDGGVSHVDTFDPKPALAEHAGEASNVDKGRKWLKSPWSFGQYGQSGMWISELFPNIAKCADDIAVIRSMKADLPIHSTGVTLLHTGHNLAGRPSLGSWMSYGLGSENENLPGYVVLSFGHVPVGGLEVFGSGFLPARHQATIIRADGAPMDNIVPVDTPALQGTKLDFLRRQDEAFSARLGGNDAVESAVRNYELAARMQSLLPDVLDERKESPATRELYGLDAEDANTHLYARQCLRARRLVESGVRFIQVNCPYGQSNGTWDQHGNLKAGHEKNARQTDRAVAALIMDLKQRGLLESTLVLWAGEFGRTPHSPGTDGRDHHPEGFTVFLAGGGVKGGTVYGATDEFGVHAVENVTDFHDLHATVLHLAGINHEKLTFRYAGRDFRLTDVSGHVVYDILA